MLTSADNIDRAHRAIRLWYKAYGRKSLPWRNTDDPYVIYVSEIMLQQTQVKTVLERYYSLFFSRFPTIEALASAAREEVLKAWQGLGYYQRAVNLHKAVQTLVGTQGKECKMPDTVEALKRLPGVGENTARAVAAFAFRRPVAVMEANVKRVLCRVFALKNPATKVLFAKADALLDRTQPFDYNQAMMDIGAMICAPKTPKCGECPLAVLCAGKKTPEHYPARKKQRKTPLKKKIIVVFYDAAGKCFVEPRATRFLHGLYGFTEFAPGTTIHFGKKHYRKRELTRLGSVAHGYSHFRLDAQVYLARVAGKQRGNSWQSAREIERLPLSQVDVKVLSLVGKVPLQKRHDISV